MLQLYVIQQFNMLHCTSSFRTPASPNSNIHSYEFIHEMIIWIHSLYKAFRYGMIIWIHSLCIWNEYMNSLSILMSCPSWQWHRTWSSWSPVWTLQEESLCCDLGFVPNSSGNKAAVNLCPIWIHSTKSEFMIQISSSWIHYMNSWLNIMIKDNAIFWICGIEFSSEIWDDFILWIHNSDFWYEFIYELNFYEFMCLDS